MRSQAKVVVVIVVGVQVKIENNRITEILEGFKHRKVVVVGDIMLDSYIWGMVDRVSPEAPIPVVDVIKEENRLGGAGNVARNISSLGASVSMASVVGSDASGNKVLEMIENDGIDYSVIEIDNRRKTSTKTRVIAHTQHVVRIDREDRYPISDDRVRALLHGIQDIRKLDAIIVSDYNKGVITKELMREIVIYGNTYNIPIIVDPKTEFKLYSNCTCITPNIKELEGATGIKCDTDQAVSNAGKSLMERLNLPTLLITRGALGMTILEKTRPDEIDVKHIPTFAQEVYDIVGAGDSVIAVYTLAITSGATSREAALIANVAAGIVVGEVGAATTTIDKLLEECTGILGSKY
jgi:D-beta-D-heptose 7-phosphate kinase/D-beta-D-heptose 1-phosphate adenosyltransferase